MSYSDYGLIVKDVTRHEQILEPEMDYIQRIRQLEDRLEESKYMITGLQLEIERERRERENVEPYLETRVEELKKSVEAKYQEKKNVEIELKELQKAKNNLELQNKEWERRIDFFEKKAEKARLLQSREQELEEKVRKYEVYLARLHEIEEMDKLYTKKFEELQKIEELKMKKIEEYNFRLLLDGEKEKI